MPKKNSRDTQNENNNPAFTGIAEDDFEKLQSQE